MMESCFQTIVWMLRLARADSLRLERGWGIDNYNKIHTYKYKGKEA